jgi:hypothetical protein
MWAKSSESLLSMTAASHNNGYATDPFAFRDEPVEAITAKAETFQNPLASSTHSPRTTLISTCNHPGSTYTHGGILSPQISSVLQELTSSTASIAESTISTSIILVASSSSAIPIIAPSTAGKSGNTINLLQLVVAIVFGFFGALKIRNCYKRRQQRLNSDAPIPLATLPDTSSSAPIALGPTPASTADAAPAPPGCTPITVKSYAMASTVSV